MGGSLTVVKHNPPVSERDQSPSFQPFIGQPLLDSLGAGAVPISFARHATINRQLCVHAEFDQVTDLGADGDEVVVPEKNRARRR